MRGIKKNKISNFIRSIRSIRSMPKIGHFTKIVIRSASVLASVPRVLSVPA